MTYFNYGNPGSFYGFTGTASTTGLTSTYGNNARITQTDIDDLIRCVQNGDTKQAIQKYNQMNPSGDSYDRNRIETAFRNYYGQSFTTAIDESAGSAFGSGFKQGIAVLGLFDDGYCGNELESMVTGLDESATSKIAEGTGAAISGAVTYGAAFAGVGALVGKLTSIGAATAGPIGAGIGVVAGLAIGIGTVIAKDQQNKKASATA